MQITITQITKILDEHTLYERLLPLDGAKILELGCGTAEHTRRIARGGTERTVVAYEIDRIQHEKNLQADAEININFKYGGAQSIDQTDDEFDIVFLFKSLHHVPIQSMDAALGEIARVLKPGGYAYISEPIFAGAFNEILRLFHDEQSVREAAFASLKRAVDTKMFISDQQIFFKERVHFQDFAEFETKVIGATHSDHKLDIKTRSHVQARFEQHLSENGAHFESPVRVDILRKTVHKVA